MGPRKPLGMEKTAADVNDIFIVVDVSRSMEADAFKPNRLVVAKKKILEFIDLRPKDRIGIIMFANVPFTLLPLSTDMNLIKQVVTEEIKMGFGFGFKGF